MLHKLTSADRNLLAVGSIVAAVVFFLAFNLLSNVVFKRAQLDLTEDSIFTVSEGTKQVLREIDEPITLRFYASGVIDDLGPFYSRHVERVGELLQTYARLSGGNLVIERYDPQAFSPEEDLAVADGLRGIVYDTSGAQIFFGLAGRNSTDDTKTIPFLAPERASFLEYDLTRLVYDLANPEKPVIAVLGDLPLRGSQLNQFQPWRVMASMEQFFDVRSLFGSLDEIDQEVDILMLAQPASLDEKTLYALDQFVMRGGRVLAFLDPFAEVMQTRGAPPPEGSALTALEPLLAAWGVEIPADKFVGDVATAVQVRATHEGRPVVTSYLPWINLTQAYLAEDDIVTGMLEQIAIRSGGAIRLRDGATTTLEPLIRSSGEAMEIETARIQFAPDPVELLTGFAPSGETYTLAARVAGPVKSAFPDGPPAAVEDEEIRARHRAEAETPLNLVIVADADLLADRNWVQTSSLLGQRFEVPTANNGDFVVNALDNLRGSHGLIGLRGRGVSARPFEVLQVMTQRAEERYRTKEQELLQKIDDTQEKIRQLQQQEQEAGVILTLEQQETIDTFRTEVLALRRQLRDVQLALRHDVERLESWLRVINIWAVPVLIAVLAIALALVRRRRAARLQASLEGDLPAGAAKAGA